MKLFLKIIATLFFIGYIPFAPGTFGSLAAMGFIWLFKPDISWHIAILIGGFILGALSCHLAEKDFGEEDSRHIVIDEFVGYIAAVAFLPLTPGYLISAFILFRFLDILKPPPIRNIERMFKGGIGVMLDDLAAGVFTNMILQVFRMIV